MTLVIKIKEVIKINNPFSKHSINQLIQIDYVDGVRVFNFVRNIVCYNKKDSTTEVLTGHKYPLVQSLDNLPPIKSNCVVLLGYNKEHYKALSKLKSNDTITSFNEAYAAGLKKLDTKKGNPKKIAKNLYKTMAEHTQYLESRYPAATYTYK